MLQAPGIFFIIRYDLKHTVVVQSWVFAVYQETDTRQRMPLPCVESKAHDNLCRLSTKNVHGNNLWEFFSDSGFFFARINIFFAEFPFPMTRQGPTILAHPSDMVENSMFNMSLSKLCRMSKESLSCKSFCPFVFLVFCRCTNSLLCVFSLVLGKHFFAVRDI
jgi:hypothetical protein